ncbi:MAG: rRNA maturation RNase YbeY [Synechocystis sp.]
MQPSLLAPPTLELILQTDLDETLAATRSVQTVIQLPWSTWGDHWIAALADHLPPAPSYELTLLLTNNAKIQTLNDQFRHLDQPTDVLAFAALEVDMPGLSAMASALEDPIQISEPLYLGDIVISLERAAQQAQERGHDFPLEVIWLFSHGLLHLLGWDHPDETTLTTMLSQQSHLLTLIGLTPPPFI